MKRILIVEDEPQISNFIKRGLIYKGFEVIDVHNGENALQVIQNGENEKS